VDRARQTPTNEALSDKPKEENNRIPFTATYHPSLPTIGGLLRELRPVLHSSNRCKNAIKEVSIVAFRKAKSLSDYLVHHRFRSDLKDEGGLQLCKSHSKSDPLKLKFVFLRTTRLKQSETAFSIGT